MKKVVAVVLSLILLMGLSACGGSGDSSNDASAEKVTYQSILDDYTQKLKDATPGLVEEYKSEAKEHTGDINKLAEISNKKIEELAKISTEGITKMAELKNENGDDEATYEEWAGKLTTVYQDYAKEITDAYTDSAK